MDVFQLKNYKGAVLDVVSGFLVSSLDVQNFVIWKGWWTIGLTCFKVGLWTSALKKSIYFNQKKIHFLILPDLEIIWLYFNKFEFKCYK